MSSEEPDHTDHVGVETREFPAAEKRVRAHIHRKIYFGQGLIPFLRDRLPGKGFRASGRKIGILLSYSWAGSGVGEAGEPGSRASFGREYLDV